MRLLGQGRPYYLSFVTFHASIVHNYFTDRDEWEALCPSRAAIIEANDDEISHLYSNQSSVQVSFSI